MDWFRRTTSPSSGRPLRLPILLLGTVVICSTISRQTDCKPFRVLGDRAERKRGASTVAVVPTQIVIDAIDLDVLRIPPSNHLELLEGNRSGRHSIRINRRR